MEICYPDYQNSIVNLTATVLSHYGLDTEYSLIPEVSEMLEKKPRNVVVMLFDGMGMAAIERHLPSSSFLRQHFVKPLSSVFPPTTTAATQGVETALFPAAHGWLAWAVYVPEVNCNVELFRNTIHRSGGKPAASYPVGPTLMPLPKIYARLNATGKVRAESVSPFGTVPAENLEEMFQKTEALCREDGPHYLYSYWVGPDDVMHDIGVDSEETRAAIRQIDERVERLCQSLAGTDTQLFIIADHGLTAVRYRFLRDTPEVAAHLRQPMAMESRCPTFYVKPGEEDAFKNDFQKAYGEDFLLFSRQEVLDMKLFGPGAEHPKFRQNFGDFLAAAISDVCLTEAPCHESETFYALTRG